MEEKRNQITMDALITDVINFALQQNQIPIVKRIRIHNTSDDALEQVVLRLITEPEMILPYEKHLEYIPADSWFEVKDVQPVIRPEFLAQLTERMTGVLQISLYCGEDRLAVQELPLTLLAFDEWHGSHIYPELLTAFITPNHPEVAKINRKAAELMQKWTGDPSLDAYQSKNPNRVLQQAAAVYGAIQEQNIVYSEPPASFEQAGQRIRLCDTIAQQKLATCLDLTLFYTACLEAIGLHPLLILQRGHIFAGFWLEKSSFAETIQDDPSQITKRLADGINEIAVVECTLMRAGAGADFDAASASAADSFRGKRETECIIDVHRARLTGIRPLPLRIMTDDGWKIEDTPRDESELTNEPNEIHKLDIQESETAFSKQDQWSRKLLDLSLRNTLINLRITKSVIPLHVDSLGELAGALFHDQDFAIKPHPAEWKLSEDAEKDVEQFSRLSEFTSLIQAERQSGRIRTVLGEDLLDSRVVGLYRQSKTNLEENGANSLYLALGMLRWYESKSSPKARYAPIVLLPLELVRKPAAHGYIIRLRDEEPQMNITLLEMLKQEFGIAISGLDPLPQDEEHGVKLQEVFVRLRKAVMGQPRWDVVESAVLGLFSFSQFVMWNDLRSRMEEIQRNKIVRSLLDGTLAWDAEPMEMEQKVSMKNVLLPIPADASQLYAIRTAGEGKSFVLHGPPGTGKSQTITAMIANALAQGKTVLFVAEKMAALSVVQRRLDDLGLGPFCMELHSNKARKKTVLNQLRAAMEVAEESQAEGYLRKSQQAAALRTELDAYAEQLHTPQTCGYSLYELLNLYEDYADADNLLHFNTDFVAGLTADKLEDQTLMAERLISAAREVGHPAGHPLSPIGRSQYSQRLRADLPVCLQNYREALETLSKHGYTFTDAFALEHPADFAGWNLAAETAAEVEFWESVPASWTRTKDLRPLLRDMRTLCSHGSRSDTLRAALLENWNPRFLEQDAKTLKAQWNTAAEKWIVPRLLEQNKLKKHLAGYANHPMDEYTLLAQLDQLEAYQLEISTTETLSEQYAEELQDLQSGDWEGLKHFSERISQKADVLERLAGPDLRTTLSSDSRKFALIEPFRKAWESFLQARTAAIELLELSDAISEDNQDWLSAQIAMCDTIEAHQDDLKPWMVWLGIRRNCEETGLHTICKAYDQGIAHDVVQASYYKALYRALIIIAIDDSELLSSFSGAMFNEKIEQFRHLDQELRERSRQEIYSRLVSRVSGLSKSEFLRKEFAVLQKAIRSGGRGLSIRRLFEQIPNLLPQLCPCMLMSPISAAQYLDPCRAPFDLVVFDEASQLPTCKAVGALARGENAVIVGDPKQMPPTSFFTTNIEDEDNLDQEDLESILDDCLTLDIPQTHLRWHYRSRHESLIAFSNNHFYENKLYTFPSVNDRASRVSFVRVDGCFDRGRTRQNRAEAEAVVSEIIRRSKDPVLSRQSIGVVTFNIRQQTLIADLFDEACRKDPDLDHWADHAEESLFIKNLENVQGDERDVILFSVSYGPDKDGKLSINFGPLNRSGGWRRLNVAVSRARCEMVVFSTMTSEQINLSRSSAEGVEALKAFLEYAEKGRLVTRETSSIRKKPVSEGIADSICRTLHEYGFETQKNVGQSEYRIDIGVIDPKNPETYLLGILLDGSNYRDAKTTTDRELAQISVLEGLGWKIHRIWSMDWWDNHQKELRYLLSRLDELQEISIPQPDPEDPADSKEEISETEEAPDALAEDFTFSEEMDSSESENALGEARDTEDTASDYALHNPEETDESAENALHQPNEMDYTAHGTSHTPKNQDTASGTQLMHDTMTDRTR